MVESGVIVTVRKMTPYNPYNDIMVLSVAKLLSCSIFDC
jgi:hypothetical protein